MWTKHIFILLPGPRGVEAKLGAPVIHQVELGVVTSPDELPVSLLLAVGLVLVLGHEGEVGGDDGVAAGLDKLETLVLARSVEIIKEDAADAPGHVPMLDPEVVVTPGLRPGVNIRLKMRGK